MLLTPILLLLVLLASCKNRSDSLNSAQSSTIVNETSYDTTKFNLEIKPDTNIECSMLLGRQIVATLSNDPYYLDTTYYHRFFSAKGNTYKYRTLWPCNLPDLLNPGDTVLLSGNLYSIAGDERMPGHPFIITKIVLHDKHQNGLSILDKL